MSIELDKMDRRILDQLQRNGRMQNVELAREVGLSPSPCLRRVRRLEETGVIRRYAAILDGSKIGAGLMLYARIWFKGRTHRLSMILLRPLMKCRRLWSVI